MNIFQRVHPALKRDNDILVFVGSIPRKKVKMNGSSGTIVADRFSQLEKAVEIGKLTRKNSADSRIFYVMA